MHAGTLAENGNCLLRLRVLGFTVPLVSSFATGAAAATGFKGTGYFSVIALLRSHAPCRPAINQLRYMLARPLLTAIVCCLLFGASGRWSCTRIASCRITNDHLSLTSAGASQLSGQQIELVTLTAAQAVERLCAGSVTASEYAKALLAQNHLNACLNNFAALEPHQVPCVVVRPALSQ